ncbi:MAG: NYN domain-containing protein [Kiritimatiellae bacterium]|nr:NYN domain-containing protein [Kiritimatiellia bacterium]
MSEELQFGNMAVFCDFENIALGVRDANYESFDIRPVLERLLLKGSILVKKAYCDWSRYRAFKAAMHEAAFELIDIPHLRQSGKNSADIRLVVDALDLCYTKPHVRTFVIISGDSDFSPLVSKLRENNKTVIGVGVRNSTSELLVSNCDEFLFYDDLVRRGAAPRPSPRAEVAAGAVRRRARPASAAAAPEPGDRAAEGLRLVVDLAGELLAEGSGRDQVWGSMVKQTLKRRRPDFNESAYGFRSFNQMLEEAARRGWLDLRRDEKSGGFIITAARGEPS